MEMHLHIAVFWYKRALATRTKAPEGLTVNKNSNNVFLECGRCVMRYAYGNAMG